LPDYAEQKKFEPIYTNLTLFTGQKCKSPSLPRAAKLLWRYKHVFILGSENEAYMQEGFRSGVLECEVHDRDLIINEGSRRPVSCYNVSQKIMETFEPSEPAVDSKKPGSKAAKDQKKSAVAPKEAEKKKNAPKKQQKQFDLASLQRSPALEHQFIRSNFGVARFGLKDFLRSKVRELKLLAPIIPKRALQVSEAAVLDLNARAKAVLPNNFASASFFQSNSFLVVILRLGRPLGSFCMPAPIP